MSFDGRTGFVQDLAIDGSLDGALKHLAPSEILKAFPVYARRIHLKRFLAHYELFRRVIDLPGDIAELGVYKGISLMSWANFLEIHNMGDRQKRVWGFDGFEGLPGLSPEDGAMFAEVGKEAGGYLADAAQVERAIEIFDADRFIPYKPRVVLVKGDICETVPQWVKDNPGVRLKLVHFDCDLYQPTLAGLQALWPLVVPGGIVAFDEYGLPPWEGESRAVDEFLGRDFPIRRFPWSANPGAYVVKP